MRQRKILFVQPSSYDARGTVVRNRCGFIPSRTLAYLAALTPSRFDVRIVEEPLEEVDFGTDADVVAFTGLIHQIPRAIDIASKFKAQGKTSIIGGVGLYAVEEMVRQSGAFDACVLGEAEELWPAVLDDLECGRLLPRYECTGNPQLDGLPVARFDLLPLNRYMNSPIDPDMPMLPIETGRGCPNNCRYCLVTRFFGHKMRYRPIRDIVAEIKYQKARHIVFTDDNIAAVPARAQELFEAIRPIGIQWFGQFESQIVHNPNLLHLAAKSGCRSAFVGVESLDAKNLAGMNKSQNAQVSLKELAEGFSRHRIIVMASLIFGLDNDTPQSIEGTVEELIECGVDTMIPWMLIPIPKTPVYDDYKAQGRLLHENFSLYDGIHAVIHPKNMTADQLSDSYWRALRRFYGLRAIAPRVLHARKGRLVELIYNLRVRRQVRRGLHPFSAV
jgi:radical SAM superfamily enzyme YgiQ (UPF0313 family)